MNFSIDLNKLNTPALEGVLSHWWADHNWSVLREVCVNPKMQTSFCKVMENSLIYCAARDKIAHPNLSINTLYPDAYAQLTSKSLNYFRLEVLDKITTIDRKNFMVQWWGNILGNNRKMLKRTGFTEAFLDEGWCSPSIIKTLGASKSKTARAWLSWHDSQEIKKWSKEKVADRWEHWHEYYDVPAREAFAEWVVRTPMTSEERGSWLKKICDTPVSMRNEMKKWWETEMPIILAQGAELKPDEVASFTSISREFVINFIYNLLKINEPEIEKTLPWIAALEAGNLAYQPDFNCHYPAEKLYWDLASRGEATILDALMSKGYKPRKAHIAPIYYQGEGSKKCWRKSPWIIALAWGNGFIDEKVAKVFTKAFPDMLSESLALCEAQILEFNGGHPNKKIPATKLIREYDFLEETLKVQKVLVALNLRQIASESQTPVFFGRPKI